MMLNDPKVAKEQIDRIVNYSPQSIEFLVRNLPMGRPRGGEEDPLARFKQETCLLKKDQQKIPLVNMILPKRGGDELVLQFPREIDGKPSVTLEDKEVTLVLRIGDKNYKFKYELAKMVVAGKLEI